MYQHLYMYFVYIFVYCFITSCDDVIVNVGEL